MIEKETREITIRAHVPLRRCDGCGRLDTDAGPIQVFGRDGAADAYEATRSPAEGWNVVVLEGKAYDACAKCSARLLIMGREAAAKEAAARAQAAVREAEAAAPPAAPPASAENVVPIGTAKQDHSAVVVNDTPATGGV